MQEEQTGPNLLYGRHNKSGHIVLLQKKKNCFVQETTSGKSLFCTRVKVVATTFEYLSPVIQISLNLSKGYYGETTFL